MYLSSSMNACNTHCFNNESKIKLMSKVRTLKLIILNPQNKNHKFHEKSNRIIVIFDYILVF